MPDLTAVKDALRAHQIELPSWAFGNTGTRFKVFAQPGVPRTPQEKIDDAAQVHQFTGVAPSVALHIPWDKVDDYAALAAHAADHGRRDRDRQRQRVPGRRLQARQRRQPRPADPPQGRRPPAGVRRHHGRDRLAGPQAVVRRRHQLPGPGRHPRPPGPARRGAGRRSTQRLGAEPADGAGVQAVRAVVLHHRRAGLGHVAAALPGARAAGRGRASTPGTTRRARTSSSSSRCCCGPGGWAASTSTAGSTPTTT